MRRRVSIFLLLGLPLVLAGLLGRLYLHQQLQRAGISELTWSGPGWQSGALTLDELTLTLDNGSTFELQQLALAPGWRSGVMLKRAEAGRLVLNPPAAEQALIGAAPGDHLPQAKHQPGLRWRREPAHVCAINYNNLY